MFTDWMQNFKTVVRDTYGMEQVPFRAPTYDELRQRYEAGLEPEDALWDIAAEIIPDELQQVAVDAA